MKPIKQFTIPLSSLIALIALGTAVVLVAAVLLIVRHQNRIVALDSAETLFREISGKIIARTDVVLESFSTLTDVAALGFNVGRPADREPDFARQTPIMRAMLENKPHLMSVYVGYADGTFHQVIATRGDSFLLEKYEAPAGTAFIDRTIVDAVDESRRQRWSYHDAEGKEIRSRTDARVEYDPRERQWFKKAVEAKRSVFTNPYVFSSSRLPGLTCARVLAESDGVFGADVTLTQLNDIVAGQRVTDHGLAWMVDGQRRLVACPGLIWKDAVGDDLQLPSATKASTPLVQAVANAIGPSGAMERAAPFFLEVNGETCLASATALPPTLGLGLTIVLATPVRDITGYITQMAFRIVLLGALLLVLIIPLAVLVARKASHPVKSLVREAQKIQHFDFSPSPPVESNIAEVNELAKACVVMKDTIQSKTVSLERTQEKLGMLVQEGLALSAEKRLDRLVTLIFQNARELANADGGVLYLMDGDELGVELLSLGSMSLVMGGLSDTPAPRVKLRPAITAFLNENSVLRSAGEAFNTGKSIAISGRDFSLFPTGLPEEPKDYPIQSLVVVPIVTRRNEVLGVIQLFNPSGVDLGDESGGTPGETLGFIGSLAAQAAVTLDNRNLVLSLKELFNALIKVVALSIDAKSPYTAGHCSRVPELAQMLAKAASETEEGPLKDFRLETEDDWHQLWIAAWLHDCGKVTTPEYVVDKATKLETIYNRIHEVRTRFEILRRDAELDYYRRLCSGESDAESLHRELEDALRRLEEDFAFVAACNEGGEFMTDEAKQRLNAIARRTWMRHYSDRLGISHEELRAKGEAPEQELPVQEQLLADKPEHLVPRVRDLSSYKDVHGNSLPIPEYEYNRGELYNLGIPRGTLTPEERFKITEHTLNGLEMLNQIPFPDSLRKVPEIASSHHENLIGTGYPLKKTKADLSVEARIMAIADVFEALTASDRPYKKSKTVSEALRIMTFMRNDRHIDPDLLDIFLRKGVFKQYADKYLDRSHNDVDNVTPFLRNNSQQSIE